MTPWRHGLATDCQGSIGSIAFSWMIGVNYEICAAGARAAWPLVVVRAISVALSTTAAITGCQFEHLSFSP